MANNPFVKAPSTDKRIMPPRSDLFPGGGVPAGECLDNWMPEFLVDGALCFVRAQNGIYQFEKFSMTAPSGVTCVATMAGSGVPGRWKPLAATGASKDYRALSYAYPNSAGANGNMQCSPISPGVWTAFDVNILAVNLAGSAGLTFDGGKSVVAARAMTVQIDWYLSWDTTGGSFQWDGAVMLNANPAIVIPGSICADYYMPESSPQKDSVMSACTITDLAQGDALQLVVRINGSLGEALFRAYHGNLVVTEM